MKHPYQRLLGCLVSLVSMSHVHAALGDPGADDWQLRRLQHPTLAELRAERAGQIMIYDGLTDRQVARVMDNHFNRIQSMMFTDVVITGKDGSPKEDPVSGTILTESDGCD